MMTLETTIRLSIVTVALEKGITDMDKIKEMVEYVLEKQPEESGVSEPAQLTLI